MALYDFFALIANQHVAGIVETLAGQCGNPGFQDGVADEARFSDSTWDILCIPQDCSVLVSDPSNGRLRQINRTPNSCLHESPTDRHRGEHIIPHSIHQTSNSSASCTHQDKGYVSTLTKRILRILLKSEGVVVIIITWLVSSKFALICHLCIWYALQKSWQVHYSRECVDSNESCDYQARKKWIVKVPTSQAYTDCHWLTQEASTQCYLPLILQL